MNHRFGREEAGHEMGGLVASPRERTQHGRAREDEGWLETATADPASYLKDLDDKSIGGGER